MNPDTEPRSIREEMRENLIARMRRGDELFPGIVGYDRTVIPQVENAILSGQDIILLGERGQAKTRLARSLVNLLDEAIPIVAGSEINDDPFHPISRYARDLIAERGDATPIEWVGRDRRYGEKLATPDTTIADLIGEVDPIKVAEGRYLSDELTISYGLIPRTNRGVFVINELPDLAERIQVGLLNVMEERDVQIRGYKIRLPLDVLVVASANPEDYTNRGRIITPLKDRYGSQIRTHYPETIELEIEIMDQERSIYDTDGIEVDGAAVHEGDRRRADPPGAPLARRLAALRRLGPHERGQLREHRLQRHPPRHPPRRAADRAAGLRSGRSPRLDDRQDRDRGTGRDPGRPDRRQARSRAPSPRSSTATSRCAISTGSCWPSTTD